MAKELKNIFYEGRLEEAGLIFPGEGSTRDLLTVFQNLKCDYEEDVGFLFRQKRQRAMSTSCTGRGFVFI